ncbi:MAG: AsmA family protein [Gammaproteobacteria bacterium]
METIRDLNLDGRARIGKLTIDDVQLADVDMRTTASGGRLSLKPLSAKLYGGSLQGGLSIDASGARPRVALDQTLTGIDIEPLLAAFADVRNISGKMSLKLDAAGTGKTDDEVISNLAGNLSFKLADGIYKGMDVWYEIRKARALIRRIEPPVLITPEQTPINALDMSGKISDGVLRTDQLLVEIPFLRVSGKADVNLPKKSLNSELTALVFEKPVFADDTSLEDLVNARIPLTIKGPLDDPKVRVDLQKMVQGALKESVREVIREKLGDQLREKLGLGAPVAPAGEAPANPDQQAPKKEDAVKKALDKLLGR